MRYHLGVLACGFGLFVLTEPLLAHHSFAATYDRDKTVALNGTVIALQWRNPHIWVDLDVSGVVWKCEGVAPNQLYRLGWTKDTLKTGDHVTIEGNLARNGAHICSLSTVTMPDGRRVLAGINKSGELR